MLEQLLINKGIYYYGLDLHTPADVIGNLEQDLPFTNGSFDMVVALDVLEHTDNIYKAFNELCKVSRKFVLIALPNAYEVTSRIRFIRGKPLSGKYGLPINPPPDRHRWLFSWQDAKTFIHAMGAKHGFAVRAEVSLIGSRRRLAGGRMLAELFPNLLSPWYIALLEQ